ncbi:hypothetical protein PsorP6_009923 [Peronosclerospora sorghi]|uniref:Uncharacterized protein n=1 Tax=Peronosclerospora sorghi TaxID=230839 RepID=A0ACC0VWX4_9STRA|nr:hypothetical protein PsorP6_009923 [Peronosclerospora sorghi]
MEEYLRHLNGLHMVLIAPTMRLKEGSFQATRTKWWKQAMSTFPFTEKRERFASHTGNSLEKFTARNFHMSVDQRNQCC